jgi:S1-C subfamily serine protease
VTNPKINLSTSASLAVRRSQSSSWLVRQTHAWLLTVVVTFICDSTFAADIPSLVRKTKPAVVEILCYDQHGELVATGTGFFISPDGKLLTSYHVIKDAYSIVAKTATGLRYSHSHILSAPQIYYFKEEDIAELQFDDATDVPCLYLGSSGNTVEGEPVLVIGNPDGLTGTVSDGIISAFREKGAVIQITAPISPGSSGSPVLDTESGNVIGIATAADQYGQNLNFAISADAVKVAIAKGQPLDHKPSDPEIAQLASETFRRAWQKMHDKDYLGARIYFQHGLVLQPDNWEAWCGQGMANDYLKEYERSKQSP